MTIHTVFVIALRKVLPCHFKWLTGSFQDCHDLVVLLLQSKVSRQFKKNKRHLTPPASIENKSFNRIHNTRSRSQGYWYVSGNKPHPTAHPGKTFHFFSPVISGCASIVGFLRHRTLGVVLIPLGLLRVRWIGIVGTRGV